MIEGLFFKGSGNGGNNGSSEAVIGRVKSGGKEEIVLFSHTLCTPNQLTLMLYFLCLSFCP
jgi:hypothetical protein